MKVCYLTHTLNAATGAGAFSQTLIRGLEEALPGLESVVLTSENLIPQNKWRMLRNIFKIRSVIARSDLVHALDGFPYGLIAHVAGLGLGKKSIITAIGTGAIQKLSHPLYGRFLRWAYRSAHCVTAPSRYVANELIQAVPGLKVSVITHGVTYSYWSQSSSAVVQEGKYILSVGAIKRRKGYHYILPLIAPLLKEDPTLTYVILGRLSQSPAYAKELTDYIAREGIVSQVRFLSGLSGEEMRSLYSRARLFVLAPQNVKGDVEGFGLAFLEAAAAGVPSLATKGSGADDAIEEGVSGFLVDARDTNLFHARMRRIVTDDELRDTLSLGAQEFAKRMDWSHKIQEYKKIYEAV